MPLIVDKTTPDGVRIIEASGELDRVELPYLRHTLQQAFKGEPPAVILDMSSVTYIDSSTLAMLIAESFDADKRGAPLHIVTGTGGILRSLELKGLMQVMHISESVDEALGKLGSSEG